MNASNALPQLTVRGSHYEVGAAIGENFAPSIDALIETYAQFQDIILPYARSEEGMKQIAALQAYHERNTPAFVEELMGMAEGSGQPFMHLFLLNMRGYFRQLTHGSTSKGCSDCAFLNQQSACFGHNEDASPAFKGKTYLVHVEIPGKPRFCAFCYPGFLPGNAFGFNELGICFSTDDVHPRSTQPGLGRHFAARALLEASSIEAAVQLATRYPLASGFSFTIGSVDERRIVVLETAPQAHQVRSIDGWYFHANHYLEINPIRQVINPSSAARLKRAKQILSRMPASGADGILELLSDQSDEQYPLFRTARPPDPLLNLCTALFDLDAGVLRIFKQRPVSHVDGFMEISL